MCEIFGLLVAYKQKCHCNTEVTGIHPLVAMNDCREHAVIIATDPITVQTDVLLKYNSVWNGEWTHFLCRCLAGTFLCLQPTEWSVKRVALIKAPVCNILTELSANLVKVEFNIQKWFQTGGGGRFTFDQSSLALEKTNILQCKTNDGPREHTAFFVTGCRPAANKALFSSISTARKCPCH